MCSASVSPFRTCGVPSFPTVADMENHTVHDILKNRGGIDADIVQLIASGKTDKEIAGILFLAHQTVRNKVSRILHATGMMNRTQLAVTWLVESQQVA